MRVILRDPMIILNVFVGLGYLKLNFISKCLETKKYKPKYPRKVIRLIDRNGFACVSRLQVRQDTDQSSSLRTDKRSSI